MGRTLANGVADRENHYGSLELFIDVLKTILRSALNQQATTVLLCAGREPEFNTPKGITKEAKVGPLGHEHFHDLFKKLFPQKQEDIKQGKITSAQMTIVGVGDVWLIARPSQVPALNFYLPPDGKKLFDKAWAKIEQGPAAQTIPYDKSKPPPATGSPSNLTETKVPPKEDAAKGAGAPTQTGAKPAARSREFTGAGQNTGATQISPINTQVQRDAPRAGTIWDRFFAISTGMAVVAAPRIETRFRTSAKMMARASGAHGGPAIAIDDPARLQTLSHLTPIEQVPYVRDLDWARTIDEVAARSPSVVFIGVSNDDRMWRPVLEASRDLLIIVTRTVCRVVDVMESVIAQFGPFSGDYLVKMFARSLQAVSAQKEWNQYLVNEMVIANDHVRDLIRSKQVSLVQSYLKCGSADTLSRNQSLMDLLARQHIQANDALTLTYDPEDILERLMKSQVPIGGVTERKAS